MLPLLDLVGRHGQQLLARARSAGQQRVGVRRRRCGRERAAGLEEVLELTAALPGEERGRARCRCRCGTGRRRRRPWRCAGRRRRPGTAARSARTVGERRAGSRSSRATCSAGWVTGRCAVLLDADAGCRCPRSARRELHCLSSTTRYDGPPVFGCRPARTTSARLLVSGSWYSNSISTSSRPAEIRSARRAGMLRSHERTLAARSGGRSGCSSARRCGRRSGASTAEKPSDRWRSRSQDRSPGSTK